MHNHAAVAALAIAVVLLLLFRRARAGPECVAVTGSRTQALGVLLAGLAAFVYVWARRHPAAARTAAAPRPGVVTRTVTRYVPLHNWPVSGFELTVLGLGAIAAAVLIVRLAGRYFGR